MHQRTHSIAIFGIFDDSNEVASKSKMSKAQCKLKDNTFCSNFYKSFNGKICLRSFKITWTERENDVYRAKDNTFYINFRKLQHLLETEKDLGAVEENGAKRPQELTHYIAIFRNLKFRECIERVSVLPVQAKGMAYDRRCLTHSVVIFRNSSSIRDRKGSMRCLRRTERRDPKY